MSLDDEIRARGQIMSDYLDAKSKLVALESEAKRIAGILNNLGEKLSTFFFAIDSQNAALTDYPTSEQIKELLANITAVLKKKRNAERQLKELGFEVKN